MKTPKLITIALFSLIVAQSQMGCTVTIPIEASGTIPAIDESSTEVGSNPQGPRIPKPVNQPDSTPVSAPSTPDPVVIDEKEPDVDPAPGEVSEEAPLLKISVNAENGGINPAFRAYSIQGLVEIGSNPCTAQARKASLGVEVAKDGKQHIVARILNGVPATRCIQIYNPVYANVKITVNGDSKLAETVIIHNVEEMGVARPLSAFLVDENKCADTECIDEEKPVACNMNGVLIKGSNLCFARASMTKIACEKGLKVDVEKFKCEAGQVD